MSNWEYRTFDGSNNNLANPTWGKANTPLLRIAATPAYQDGISSLAIRSPNNPNPREISNAICQQNDVVYSNNALSDFVWAWGQFLDHELDLTRGVNPTEEAHIPVSTGDPVLAGGGIIPFTRSLFDGETGTEPDNPRQQVNEISAYIDATNVYGANILRVCSLRAFDGTGRLKVTHRPNGDLLPYNVAGFPNANHRNDSPDCTFVAGDIRCNEHAVLTCLHTLFVREHNRLCDELLYMNPSLAWNDEELYQRARKIVGALMQVITFKEFLPALLGENAISQTYPGYDSNVNASITNEFAHAFYRLGHSMVSGELRLGMQGMDAYIPLRDAFFDADVVKRHGLDAFLSGLAIHRMQEVDTLMVDDLRSFLFDAPQNGVILDLAALNIQRGRDHGLPDYNTCRKAYGLAPVTCFSEITSDSGLRASLQAVYGDVNGIDPWVGGLAEDHLPNANVGPLVSASLKDQFERLRTGDRFWYRNDPFFTSSPDLMNQIENTTLADIVQRNTHVTYLTKNVFKVPDVIF